jgi:hypothetical protein
MIAPLAYCGDSFICGRQACSMAATSCSKGDLLPRDELRMYHELMHGNRQPCNDHQQPP